MDFDKTSHHIKMVPHNQANSSNTTTVSSKELFSWQSPPNVRGTWSILFECLCTLTYICYYMLHLNIPATTEGFWQSTKRKIRWLVFSYTSPELPLLFAMGQRISAKSSVENASTRSSALDNRPRLLCRRQRLLPRPIPGL